MVHGNPGLYLAQRQRPRVVQYNKRRHSIRLETVFWRSLERIAERRNMRIGHLVAELAAGAEVNNLASYLRTFCMFETERNLSRANLGASRTYLSPLLAECPAAGMILSQERTILEHNTALSDWLGQGHQPLLGADLTTLFQVRTARPFNNIWSELLDGRLASAHVHVVHVARGRVSAAQARLVPLSLKRQDGFSCVAWLSTQRAVHTGPSPHMLRSETRDMDQEISAFTVNSRSAGT